MAQKIYAMRGDPQTGFPIIGENSQQFSVADPVTAQADGFLDIAAAAEKILGWSVDSRTMAATNQTVAKAKPLYLPAEGILAQITGDIAVTQTVMDSYSDFSTATTGAYVVDVTNATSSTAQVHILGSPDPDSLSTDVIVEVAEPQTIGYVS